MRSRHFVRFSRPFEDETIRGYVLAVGREMFLIAVVSDQIRFNGFQAFRIRDVRKFARDPFAAFAESALRARRGHRPRRPKVSIANLRRLLQSAGRTFTLVTIHRERIDPSVCWIGRVVKVGKDRLSLLEIGPDAVWNAEPTEYSLRDITKVEFGGDYEGALYLVGGEPSGPPSGAKRPIGPARAVQAPGSKAGSRRSRRRA